HHVLDTGFSTIYNNVNTLVEINLLLDRPEITNFFGFFVIVNSVVLGITISKSRFQEFLAIFSGHSRWKWVLWVSLRSPWRFHIKGTTKEPTLKKPYIRTLDYRHIFPDCMTLLDH